MPLFQRRQRRRALTLQEALDAGLVRFEVWGREHGVAARLRFRLTKLTPEPLRVLVPRGSEFVPVAEANGSPGSEAR